MIFEAVIDWNEAVPIDTEVARLRRRDPDTLAVLVSRYQHRLYRYMLRLVRDPATAEDLFQQTWLRVVRNIRRYDPRRNFDTWLFTIAHNLATDHLRRRQPESLYEPGMDVPAREPAAGPDALERVLEGERARILAAILAELPAAYREAVILRFEEDMKLEEIAEVTHAPLSTVKSRLRRALESLRRKLEARLSGEFQHE